MGISGLLKLLGPLCVPRHIREYAGQTVAVDASCWLHRSSYSCAYELAKGKPTRKYLDFCMHFVQLLKAHKVTPLIVFDGGHLPAKSETNAARKKSRDAYRRAAEHAEATGDMKKAFELYQRCVTVTNEMKRRFMEALRAAGIDFVVAPYEADAQISYEYRQGRVSCCITEDSDLSVFEVPAFLKMDRNGMGLELDLNHGRRVFALSRSSSLPASSPVSSDDDVALRRSGSDGAIHSGNAYSAPYHTVSQFENHMKMRGADAKTVSMLKTVCRWRADKFRDMCVLAGCDYLSSLAGIGLKTAYKHIGKFANSQRLLKHLQGSSSPIVVPAEYPKHFEMAVLTFAHQRVYDRVSSSMVHLTALPNEWKRQADRDPSSVDFLGPLLPAAVARGIAEGHIDPKTKKQYGPLPPLEIAPKRVRSAASTPASSSRKGGSAPPSSRAQAPRASFFASPIAMSASARPTNRAAVTSKSTTGIKRLNPTTNTRVGFLDAYLTPRHANPPVKRRAVSSSSSGANVVRSPPRKAGATLMSFINRKDEEATPSESELFGELTNEELTAWDVTTYEEETSEFVCDIGSCSDEDRLEMLLELADEDNDSGGGSESKTAHDRVTAASTTGLRSPPVSSAASGGLGQLRIRDATHPATARDVTNVDVIPRNKQQSQSSFPVNGRPDRSGSGSAKSTTKTQQGRKKTKASPNASLPLGQGSLLSFFQKK